MAIQSIPEFYTDQIEAVGQVKRIYFYCRILFDDGHSEWHYFGTLSSTHPPFTNDPVYEHIYVQFPQGLDDLNTWEAEDILYSAGRISGFKREGLT